jgi:hypothetical protein
MTTASLLDTIKAPLDALVDLSQGLLKLRDLTKIGEIVVKFNNEIMATQRAAMAANTQQAAMAEEIGALKARVTELETWDREDKENYELKPLGQGVRAYAIKGAEPNSENAHSICPDCYQQSKKRILQQVTKTPGHADVLVCQTCGWEGYIYGNWRPEHGAPRKR